MPGATYMLILWFVCNQQKLGKWRVLYSYCTDYGNVSFSKSVKLYFSFDKRKTVCPFKIIIY